MTNLRTTVLSIAAMAIGLLPAISAAKPITTTDILQNLRKGEPWDRGIFAAPKMVMFQQATNTSGGTDATSVSKITLRYFTSNNCTATNGTSVPTYTTPDGTSFTINVGTEFGMVAASAWNVGNSKVSPTVAVAYPNNDITNIQSIAVTLKSTNNNTPQASFTGLSYACVPVTCTAGPGGACTSGSGTQGFQLKTTAAIGDPADGGVIACMNGGLNNLVAPTTNNSSGIVWGGSGTTTGADSITDGAANTAAIIACLTTGTGTGCAGGIGVNTYAAGICSTYSAAGGFTSGWFLPAANNTTASGQLNCLHANREAIGGFGSNDYYWSSTEANANNAWYRTFSPGFADEINSKGGIFWVRCVQAFVP